MITKIEPENMGNTENNQISTIEPIDKFNEEVLFKQRAQLSGQFNKDSF